VLILLGGSSTSGCYCYLYSAFRAPAVCATALEHSQCSCDGNYVQPGYRTVLYRSLDLLYVLLSPRTLLPGVGYSRGSASCFQGTADGERREISSQQPPGTWSAKRGVFALKLWIRLGKITFYRLDVLQPCVSATAFAHHWELLLDSINVILRCALMVHELP
jgi:hypothetical protein